MGQGKRDKARWDRGRREKLSWDREEGQGDRGKKHNEKRRNGEVLSPDGHWSYSS